MISAKIKSKKNGKTQKFLKSLKELSSNHVEVGHFSSSGLHGDSDLTYPELLKLWSHGQVQEGVIKNPLANFIFTRIDNKKYLSNPRVKAVYKRWSKNILNKGASEKFLMEMGEVLRDEYADVFGRVGVYMPIVGDNATPMYDTGELRDNTAYKTSFNSAPKEIKPL